MRVTADGIEEIPNPQTEITELPDNTETPEEVPVPAEPAQDSSLAEPVSAAADKTAPAPVPGPIVPVSVPNGRGTSPAPVKRRRSPLRLILSIAAVLILAASVVWGFSLLSRLFPRSGRTVKNALTVIAGDNDELKGYSSSGKIIRYKTEEGVRESLLSPDGSRYLFLTTEKRLMMFDGSRFTEIAEDVKTFVFSFDSSAAAYLTSENDLYLYRRNRSQRIASDVTENFCLSPDGKTAAYVKNDGDVRKACYYDGREREIAKDAVPAGISAGGRYIYYYSSTGVLYVQKGSNTDSRQKLVDHANSLYFNAAGDQVLVSDGTNTYFSQKGGERRKIAARQLMLVLPQGMATDVQGFCGTESLKDAYYASPGTDGSTLYLLNGKLELSSLIKNVQVCSLLSDGRTLIYSKNGNLYQMDLKKTQDRETKLADSHRGFLVGGRSVLFIDEEGETWFARVGSSARRITADTVDLTGAAANVGSGFVYGMEGALYYTNGGKPVKINGLSDDVMALDGNGFWVKVTCKNGDVYVSTNGRKFNLLSGK